MALAVKNSLANAGDVGDVGSIPGLGRSPGEGNGNPLQYSCLEIHGQRRLTDYSPSGLRELDIATQQQQEGKWVYGTVLRGWGL